MVLGIQRTAGVILLRVVLYGCLSLLILGGYAAARFHGLRSSEAMEFAHVARNLSTGQGFTTRCVRPFDLWYLQQRSPDIVPGLIQDVHHAPAYPLLLSWLYRLTTPSFDPVDDRGGCDAEYQVILPLAIGLTLLCALVIYVTGLWVFGPQDARLATVLYLISNLTLGAMLSGVPVPLLSLTVTLSCGLAIRAIQLAATGEHLLGHLLLIVGSALAAGVAVLTDYSMIAVCVGLLVLLALQLQRLRWVSLLLFLIVCGGVIAPWLLHNHHRGIGVLGARPYTAVSNSVLYRDDTLARSVAPEFNSYRVSNAIRQKLITSVSETITGRGVAAGGIMVCFFVLALFHRYENPEVGGLKVFVLGSLALLALSSPLIGPPYAVFAALFPLVVLLGTSAFVDYLSREDVFVEGVETLLMWALVAACALPAVAQVVGVRPAVYPPYYAPIQRFVCSLVQDEEVLYTDIPWATAWYGDRTSILLPNAISDIETIHDGWNHVGGLYLTSETGNRAAGEEATWRPLLHQQVPESVPLRHAIQLPANTADQLFLTDRPRWNGGE